MKTKTRKLIRLGQSIGAKYQLGEEVSTTDKWENAPADTDGYAEKVKFELEKE